MEYVEEHCMDYEILPAAFYLSEAYPNPFNTSTSFDLKLPKSNKVNIEIIDILGRKVRSVNKNVQMEGGNYTVTWNGKNQIGESVSSGIYFLIVQSNNYSWIIRKVMLLK